MNIEGKQKNIFWTALVLVISVVVIVNLFRGLTVQKIGIPGMFEIEFGTPSTEQVQDAEILAFESNPARIDQGASASLHWETSNAAEVTLEGEQVAITGSRVVRPTQTTTYQLIAQNEENEAVTSSIEVIVAEPTEPDTDTPPEPEEEPDVVLEDEDCLPYNPNNLTIEDEGSRGWLLTDGSSRMLMLANERDANKALALAKRHTSHCFIGRDNQRSNRDDYIVEYWKGRSGIATAINNEDCLPYNPNNLTIRDEGARGWLLTDGGSRMLMLANKSDAQKALALAKQHTAHCFIGRSNQQPNRQDYVHEYWK